MVKVLGLIPVLVLNFIILNFADPFFIPTTTSLSAFTARFVLSGIVLGVLNVFFYYLTEVVKNRHLSMRYASLRYAILLFIIPILLNIYFSKLLSLSFYPVKPPVANTKYSYEYVFAPGSPFPGRKMTVAWPMASKNTHMQETAKYVDELAGKHKAEIRALALGRIPASSCEKAFEAAAEKFDQELSIIKNKAYSNTLFRIECLVNIGGILPAGYKFTITRSGAVVDF